MRSYDEVHACAIVQAESLLRRLRETRDNANNEVEHYCKGYKLRNNTYPPTQRHLLQRDITNFGHYDDLLLRYFTDDCIYASSFGYEFTQEEQHIADSIYPMPLEVSGHFTEEELDKRSIFRSVTFSLLSQTVEEKILHQKDGIYFEKTVSVENEQYLENDASITLTQDDEPGMLIRNSNGLVVDLYPAALAVDGNPVSFCVTHDGRTPYLLEHIRTSYLVQNVVRMENCHTGEKSYYLIPLHGIHSMSSFFVLQDALYYLSGGNIVDANNGDVVGSSLPNLEYSPIVSNGKEFAYYDEKEGSVVIQRIVRSPLAVGLGLGLGMGLGEDLNFDSVVPAFGDDYVPEDDEDDEDDYVPEDVPPPFA
jgi:hypothetical protein